MQHILIFILTLFLNSCSTKSFDKDYYERTTGIKFPNKYKVLQTFDNGEFMTGTVFQIDSIVLQDFILNNHFDTLIDKQYFTLQSATFFDKQLHPDISSNHKYFIIRKSKNKNWWTYLVDMTTHKLWAEISYPDWGWTVTFKLCRHLRVDTRQQLTADFVPGGKPNSHITFVFMPPGTKPLTVRRNNFKHSNGDS